jgi:tetratricopeptide (TPR) repeat protein
LHEEIGDKRGMANSLNDLGKVAFQAGNYEEAHSLLKQSLALSRNIDDHRGVVRSLDNLGHVAEAQNQDKQAAACFQEALSDALDLDATPVALDSLVGLATLLIKKRDHQPQFWQKQAAELLVFVIGHPASEQETRQNAESLLTDLPKEHLIKTTSTKLGYTNSDLSKMADKVNQLIAA